MSRSVSPKVVDSPVPGVIPDRARVHGRVPDPAQPETAQAPAPAETESRTGRARRKAHRGRLHLYAFVAVALLAYVIALGTSNTLHVKVHWVFGTSSVSLVWLVIFAAIAGWLLGILVTVLFRWRTRAPRSS